MANTTVKFVNDDLDFSGPVEPQLLRDLQHENRDRSLSSPTPSVLQALSCQSVSLYDLGIRSGIEWGHRYLEHDHRNPYQSMAYAQYERMQPLVDRKRAHLYRSYAEGWLNGWHATMNFEV